jgi:hypothetical protein
MNHAQCKGCNDFNLVCDAGYCPYCHCNANASKEDRCNCDTFYDPWEEEE